MPPIDLPGSELIQIPVDGMWLGPITISFTKMKIRNRDRGYRCAWMAYRARIAKT